MSQPTTLPSLTPEYRSVQQKPTHFRWVICALLFFATTINYVDRSVLTVISPDLKKAIGWTDYQFGLINAAFSLAYGIGFLIMGWLIDKVGVKISYALGLIFWSLSAAAAGLTRNPLQFGLARFFLGLGEAVNFPAAIKTTAEWFPQRERATATGIFNSGSNIGIIVAPLVIPYIVIHWGWQSAFYITGGIGLLWVFFWLPLYKSPDRHPNVNQAERNLIVSGDPKIPPGTVLSTEVPKPVKWRFILPHRQAWAFIASKFLTDPVWWFYLFFSGQFLTDTFKVSIKTIGWPLITIYGLADFGSIAGGWLSSTLIKRGLTPNRARKTAMLVCAICVLPVIIAPLTSSMWLAVIVIGIAAAAHQGYSANNFTLTSDLFPKRAVGSVVGLGGFAGAMGGVLIAATAGLIKELTGNLIAMFVVAGCIYLVAVLTVHLLVPRLEPVTEETLESKQIPPVVFILLWSIIGLLVGGPLSYFFQDHSLALARSFPVYLSGLFTGDIFAINPLKERPELSGDALNAAIAEMRAIRLRLGPALVWTPIAAAAITAVIAGVFRAIFPPAPISSRQPAR